MVFTMRDGSPFMGQAYNAKKIGERVAALACSSDFGELEPATVVADARDPKSPLNKLPCWDGFNDSTAAEKHYLQVARTLIGSIMCTTSKSLHEKPTRAFPSVDKDGGRKGQAYVGVQGVLGNTTYRDSLLKNAKSEFVRFEYVYKNLTELEDLFAT